MKYIKTAIVLCLICGICAVLIAFINTFTAPKIAENKIKAQDKACSEIYPNMEYEEIAIDGADEAIEKKWAAKENGVIKGYIYSLNGKNSYGNISLLVGINLDGSTEKVVLTTNTQSYAKTVKKHVNSSYNNGPVSDLDSIDVKCGATFGATLVKELVTIAVNDYKGGNN